MKSKQDTTWVEEMIAFAEVDGVGVALFQSDTGLKLTVSGSTEFIKEIPLNQQLQKAREEERERIYSLQSECREKNLFSHRNRLCVCYQSELNQDTKIKEGAKDFASRFEKVMKELSEE